MKHQIKGRCRSNRIGRCVQVTLLVTLLAACGGSPQTPVTGNPVLSTTVASTPTTALRSAGSGGAATSGATGTESSAAATMASSTITALASSVVATTPIPTTTPGNAATAADLAPPDQQILRANWGEPNSLDPQAITSANDAAVVEQLFTGLTRFALDLKPVPAIAESWQFNQDGTQITFKLRDSTWSDGKPVTAMDFAYAMRRGVDPALALPGFSPSSGTIKGETELSTTPVSDSVKLEQARANYGVKALDAHTLQVTLTRPVAYFPSLASGIIPLRQDLIEQYGAKWAEPAHLIGNGPFVLQSWTKGSEMTLAANSHYYAGAPKLTALTLKFITNAAAAFANYQADAVDISSVPAPEVPHIQSDPQLKNQIYRANILQTLLLRFTTTKPPFNDVRVRQAFAAAIDRQTLVEQVLHSVGTPAYSFIPPGMPGHLSEADARGFGQFYDPAKAQRLLAEAGYPGGRGFPALTLPYRNAGSFPLTMQRIQADLQNNLHITINLDPRDPKSYFASIPKNPSPIYDAGWVAALPDPSDFDGSTADPSSVPGSVQNPEFKRLVDEAEHQTDPDKRLTLYQQAEQVMAQDAPAIFLYWGANFRLVKPYVKGLVASNRGGFPGQGFLQDVYIVKH